MVIVRDRALQYHTHKQVLVKRGMIELHAKSSGPRICTQSQSMIHSCSHGNHFDNKDEQNMHRSKSLCSTFYIQPNL